MEDSDSRGRTVRVAPWWREAAKRRIAELDLRQGDLALELGVSEASVSRDLGTNVNVENVKKLAARLDLPSPVVVPASELEARAIEDLLKRHHQREAALQEVDAAVSAVTSDVSQRSHRPRQNTVGKLPRKKRIRTPPRP